MKKEENFAWGMVNWEIGRAEAMQYTRGIRLGGGNRPARGCGEGGGACQLGSHGTR